MIRVVDGDTIVINDNGKKEKVRLLCVNTPESVHPDKKQNIPMGKVASRYTQKKLTLQSTLTLSLKVTGSEEIMGACLPMSLLIEETST